MEFVPPSPNLVSIVDDDPFFRVALAGLVCAFGFPVAPFASAAAFLDSGVLKTVVCLISDVNMPELGGFALYDRLETLEAPIPTVFVSAAADEHMNAAALARGALACLGKPVDPDDLLRLIQTAIRIGKASRQLHAVNGELSHVFGLTGRYP